ncbi:MAG: glycosyl hydrolase 43 family protein [Herpetosiphonaceae bacterium]|nr:glycosyl hydrolase 43 family protein [Herpetosiphonaceae bacterium]
MAARSTHNNGSWGDQGNGTYHNPILPADYSDLDAIRVGNDYYAISSTFQFSPGIIVLHSQDLVNWSILGHVVTDLTQIGPELNWTSMDRYGRGIWAPAIRYHDGRYWVYFCTPDEGLFMSTAASPAGPWAPLKQLFPWAGWDDCCPFWDEDGLGYLIVTHFSDNYKIHLFRLTVDGTALVPGTDQVIHQSAGSEASKLFKEQGLYYHFFSEVHNEGRVPMMARAKHIYGPYEVRQLMHVNRAVDKEPNQGGLLQLPSGAWYFLTHQGSGDWEGRAACLLPVTWVDGWPIIGHIGADGIGNIVWSDTKPIRGCPATAPQTSDEFSSSTLGVQWEWNYQPRADRWSLRKRPGWLRLQAFPPLRPGDFRSAGNTLSQRSMRTTSNVVTIKMDISHMTDGQQAGLCHFSWAYSLFGVVQSGSSRTLYCNNDGQTTFGPPVVEGMIWLQSHWGFDGRSHYGYSLDGTCFTDFGAAYQLTWGAYRGDRFGIYCFNDQGESGFVDVDWLHYALRLQDRTEPQS